MGTRYHKRNIQGLMAYSAQTLNEIRFLFSTRGRLPEAIDELHHVQARLIDALAYLQDDIGFGTVSWDVIMVLRSLEQDAADLLSCEAAPFPGYETYFETPKYTALVAKARAYVGGQDAKP